MPKKILADTTKDEVRILIEELNLSRSNIAEKLGVTVHALDSWVRDGRIPLTRWKALLELKDSCKKRSKSALSEASLEELLIEIQSRGYDVRLNIERKR